MPVYSVAGSMEHLKAEVYSRAQDMIIEYQLKAYTDQPLVNLATGYVLFARDEKNLFRFLCIEEG